MTLPDRAVEFWFDFSSAYAYFASLEIDALAARCGRTVRWRPFMLGAAFARTGATGLSRTPLKGDYARRDWARIARRLGVSFAPPPDHPVTALAATRLFYAVEEQNARAAADFARSVFREYYRGRLDTGTIDAMLPLVEAAGADARAAARRCTDPAFKADVRAIGEGAVAAGIFGSPWFVANGEPFWGWDRLPMVEAWLKSGGW